jgi:hypothetical protein
MTYRLRSTVLSTRTVALGLALIVSAGCASSPRALAPPPPSAAAVDRLDGVRRIVIVGSGQSRFTVGQGSKEPGPEIDQALKWLPYQELLVPIARAVYWGVSWLMESSRSSSAVPADVTPAIVVADAFAQALRGRGAFDVIATVEREPVGDSRRDADAIVRLTVPAWGLVDVREGDPRQVSAFADVRAQIVLRETGVVVWEHDEDVTHPERLSLQTLTGDRELRREQLVAVLERAGRRLASELLYARSGGQ